MTTTYDCLYVSGCSFTYGQGLPEKVREQQNWAGLIGARLNVPVINDAVGGAGNDRIFRTAMTSISRLLYENKNPLVIICWSAMSRREIYDIFLKNYRAIIPPPTRSEFTVPALRDKFDQLYFKEHSSEEDDVIKTLIYKISLQSFLKERKITHLYTETWEQDPTEISKYRYLIDQINQPDTKLVKLYNKELELPCGHPNADGHKFIAKRLLKEIKNEMVQEASS
jgi:hypothetical protein